MDNNKLKWYEEHIEEYFNDTIYHTDNLMVELSADKWYKINPERGIRKSLKTYDLTEKRSKLSDFFCDCYGETEYARMVIDKKTFRFSRRNTAAGGALYPNVIYAVIRNGKKINVYQYNSAMNLLHYINTVESEKTELKENICYLAITVYYWRNWLKYRFFGYRLMNVDTGYLAGNIYCNIARRKMNGKIIVSDQIFNNIEKYIGIDKGEEALCCVIAVDDTEIVNDFSAFNESVICRYHSDWDKEDIHLYKAIEEKVSKCQFDIVESVKENDRIFNSELLQKNRVSPGGSFMQNILDMKKNRVFRMLTDIKSIISCTPELSENIDIYFYINKVEGYDKGIYRYTPEKDELLQHTGNIDEDMQQIMKKHNFNIADTPVWIFVGSCLEEHMKKYGISGFKIMQFKVGFVSHMITAAAAVNGCFTHPILGFDAEKAEKITGQKQLLNLIALSDVKKLDRQTSPYSR